MVFCNWFFFLIVLVVGSIFGLMKMLDVLDYFNLNLVIIELFLGYLSLFDWLMKLGRKVIEILRDWIYLWIVC